MLVGMPAPRHLHRVEVDGQVLICVGATVMFSYDAGDSGLRNLAAVTLPEMGFTGRRVARVLGITEEYVSMLRARARARSIDTYSSVIPNTRATRRPVKPISGSVTAARLRRPESPAS